LVSFCGRGGFSLSREASPPRFGQLQLEVVHLSVGALSGFGALPGFPS
jgi:hypothetical protein